MEGRELPRDFNHLRGVFIPRGAEASDSEGMYRGPAQTRPLGLENTDTKIITPAYCFEMSNRLPAFIEISQR
eukprot:6066254-Pyramimonas_sp.AAC.1